MLYIIDGYNVLYSTSFKRWIEKFGLESARNHLINFIRSYKKKFIIVFDGRENYPSPNIPNVIFTKGESADEYIKRFIKNYHNKSEIVVISNDKSIRDFARKLNIKSMSVNEFLNSANRKELLKREKEIDFDKITEEIKKEWGLDF
ncbi:MAG: NYN domain-containing protein [candidate division WOR-3 bacterium]